MIGENEFVVILINLVRHLRVDLTVNSCILNLAFLVPMLRRVSVIGTETFSPTLGGVRFQLRFRKFFVFALGLAIVRTHSSI